MAKDSTQSDAPNVLDAIMVPIHRAGWPFIALFFVAAVILGFIWETLFWFGLAVTAWCVYFFRDPPRMTPTDPGLIISPADGVVQSIQARTPPPELELGTAAKPCVAVFMNVFDVHVNRAPMAGRITRRAYHPGQFLNASLDKASELNERLSWKIERQQATIGLVQIAGLVARRIVGFGHEGDEIRAGQRIGLIRFGSRCDIYLPDDAAIMVRPGQRCLAGETMIADLQGRILIKEATIS